MTSQNQNQNNPKDNLLFHLQDLIALNQNDSEAMEQIRQDLIEAVAIVETVQYQKRLASLKDVG